MNRKYSLALASGLFVALGSVPALAHTGLHDAGGFAHGLAHPMSGLDHMLAMLAVGAWAALVGGRATWAVPLSFVAAMTVAAVFGGSGVSLPLVELAIIASVVGLGLLIAARVRLPLGIGMAVVALFALAHGAAHGAEVPLGASGLAFGAGFVASTIALHAAGVVTGLMLRHPLTARLVGGAVTLAGLGLALAG